MAFFIPQSLRTHGIARQAPKRFQKSFFNFLRVDLILDGIVATQGVTDPEGTHKPARQKVCGVCVGGNLDRKFGRRLRGRLAS
jgi:hypothetical protein